MVSVNVNEFSANSPLDYADLNKLVTAIQVVAADCIYNITIATSSCTFDIITANPSCGFVLS